MARTSWIQVSPTCDFSIANIPFGIVKPSPSAAPRAASAIGDYALDLSAFAQGNGFSELSVDGHEISVYSQPSLNAFAALGRLIHQSVRTYLIDVLAENTPYADVLRNNKGLRSACLIPLAEVESLLPMSIGDYTDFYVGKNHAFNVGVLFRGPENALQPNYTHLPVGYHGRASSINVSGTPVRRPWGQLLNQTTELPECLPSKRLDIELELGAFVCKPSSQGAGVRVEDADNHIFGYVLLNDWSARDIQAWEYVPLGPFNSKNFASTISPWIVLADALEPFSTESIANDNEVLPYLKQQDLKTVHDIKLQVDLKSEYHHP